MISKTKDYYNLSSDESESENLEDQGMIHIFRGYAVSEPTSLWASPILIFISPLYKHMVMIYPIDVQYYKY